MKKLTIAIIVCSLLSASCNDSSHTSISSEKNNSEDSILMNQIAKEQRNIKIVKESLEGYNAHDAKAFLKDATDDFIDYGDGLGKPIKGKDSVIKGFQDFFEHFADAKCEDLKFFAEGDLVMVWGVWSGKWVKDLEGQKATGQSFKYNDIDVFKLNDDGKMLEHYPTQTTINTAYQVGFKLKK